LKIIQFILIAAVRAYRWLLSPAKSFVLGPMARCRFEPSCSRYALEALQIHGACKGSVLAVKRLCRCHPWGDFGPDPVPTNHPLSNQSQRASRAA
jgi:putative membrane protein insertion efficiency factor